MTNQYEQQLAQERDQAQYDAIVNAIGGAQESADAAQQRYQYAMQTGDMATAAEAQRAIARAEARLVALENGKDAWDARSIQRTSGSVYPQQQPQQYQQPNADQIIAGMTQLTPREREWLTARKHLVTNPNKVTQLQAAYMEAAEKGIQRDSDAYFAHFEDRVGGSTSGLTAAQRDAARVSGVDEGTYKAMWDKMHREGFNTHALYGVRR